MRHARWLSFAALTTWALALSGAAGYSGEHGGQEHGGSSWGSSTSTGTGSASQPSKPVPDRKTPSSKPKSASTLASPATPPAATKPSKARASGEPSVPAESIRQRIEQHVQQQLGADGTFVMEDQETGLTRRLQFVRVHERVGKTGAFYYYSCADLRDVDTGELLDLDFDVMAMGDQLDVVDARIHKIDGRARYTYDSDDNRIPIPPSQR
jgi:hypothetical protein